MLVPPYETSTTIMGWRAPISALVGWPTRLHRESERRDKYTGGQCISSEKRNTVIRLQNTLIMVTIYVLR